jgi:hypothetical protein
MCRHGVAVFVDPEEITTVLTEEASDGAPLMLVMYRKSVRTAEHETFDATYANCPVYDTHSQVCKPVKTTDNPEAAVLLASVVAATARLRSPGGVPIGSGKSIRPLVVCRYVARRDHLRKSGRANASQSEYCSEWEQMIPVFLSAELTPTKNRELVSA